MVKFAYNNTNNARTGHMPFKLNYGYHFWVSYEKNINLCSKSNLEDKLLAKLQEMIIICQNNLHCIENFKSKSIIKMLSLEAMSPTIKFC